MTEPCTVKVVSIPFGTGESSSLTPFQMHNLPPRSRLYGLVPCGMRTIWTESLTSYINRLAWTHKVSGGELVAQELVPRLRSDHPSYQLTVFCRYAAMSLNGNGELARTYSTLLEELTGRPDLSSLSLQSWIGNLSSRGQLQRRPVWCPACYEEWREQGLPIYQPLLWQYQVVTLCPEHKQSLEMWCPQCHKPQSVIATNRFQPGACTQCGAWLGTPTGVQLKQANDDEVVWQQWVLHVLEELYGASSCLEPPQWKRFFAGMAVCLQEPGAVFRLKRLTGVHKTFLRYSLNNLDEPHSYAPSLKTILKFCYACDVTPLQIMSNQLASIKTLVQKRTPRRAWSHRPVIERIDRQKCLELMQAIIDGKEEPISLRQVAKRLGYGDRTLAYNFPQECALIIKQVREYRKLQQEQRRHQICTQVRQAVMRLHAQGIYPSRNRLDSLLPAGWMRKPEAKMTWQEVLRELGLKD
jgi:ribosomal protein S27E